MRVNVQRAPTHPDNRGVIVTHVGLNVDRHWQDFKLLDSDDQEIIHDWLNADETQPSDEAERRRPLWGPLNVTQEIIDHFISDPFLDPSDDTLIDNLLAVAREQGLRPSGPWYRPRRTGVATTTTEGRSRRT